MNYCLSVLIGLFLIVPTATIAYSHPSSNYTPNALSAAYGMEGRGLPVEWEINDIDLLQDLPSPASLSDAEIYMVAGCSNGPDGQTMQPWKTLVYNEVLRFYLSHGYVPDQLTPETVASGRNVTVGETDYNYLEELKSPLTGDYPYITDASFSPGNVYIRQLTEEEKTHIAVYSPSQYRQWFKRERPGDALELSAGHEKGEPVEVLAVFYVRVYGWNGVIDTSIVTSAR